MQLRVKYYLYCWIWSILQHGCQIRATRVRHEWHECNTSETQTTQGWHEWDTSDTSATQTIRVRHECYKNEILILVMTGVKHPYISCMANEWLQGGEQFYSKNYLLEMPRSHAKMHSKSAPQKLNFVMAKVISKIYTRDCSCKCPCTFPHSYA